MSDFLSIALASSAARLLTFTVMSSGCVVLWGDDPASSDVVYVGSGRARVRVSGEGGWLFFRPTDKGGVVSIDVPELRQHEAGWTGEPSLTDLEPRPAGSISPEIRAVMDQMNRNAIIREQALLRSLGRR